MEKKDRENNPFNYFNYYKKKSKIDLEFNKKLRALKKIEKKIQKEASALTKDIENFEKSIPRKSIIIIGSFLVILLVFLGIWYFSGDEDSSFNPIDVNASNQIASAYVDYKGSGLLTLSGWESSLEYNGSQDRLFGKETYKELVFDDNGKAYTLILTGSGVILEPLTTKPEIVTKIGWFTKSEQINILNDENLEVKSVIVDLSSDSLKSSMNYTLFKNRNYFTADFSAEVDDYDNLGEFAYGINIKDYDIYLPDSRILENDNKRVSLNQKMEIIYRGEGNISQSLLEAVYEKVDISKNPVMLGGSTYDVYNNDYEIFYNKDSRSAVIVYAEDVNSFKNSFYWNVYWVYLNPLDNGKYPPLYFIVAEDADLSYDNEKNDWIIKSDDYNGYVWDYIHEVRWEIESGEAKKFKFRDLF